MADKSEPSTSTETLLLQSSVTASHPAAAPLNPSVFRPPFFFRLEDLISAQIASCQSQRSRAYRLPDGEMRPRQPLWCVRPGVSHQLWLYSHTLHHVGSLLIFPGTWCAKMIVFFWETRLISNDVDSWGKLRAGQRRLISTIPGLLYPQTMRSNHSDSPRVSTQWWRKWNRISGMVIAWHDEMHACVSGAWSLSSVSTLPRPLGESLRLRCGSALYSEHAIRGHKLLGCDD